MGRMVLAFPETARRDLARSAPIDELRQMILHFESPAHGDASGPAAAAALLAAAPRPVLAALAHGVSAQHAAMLLRHAPPARLLEALAEANGPQRRALLTAVPEDKWLMALRSAEALTLRMLCETLDEETKALMTPLLREEMSSGLQASMDEEDALSSLDRYAYAISSSSLLSVVCRLGLVFVMTHVSVASAMGILGLWLGTPRQL